MELLIGLAVAVILIALIYFNRSSRGLDINRDGKVDLDDAKAAVNNSVSGVADILDINRDGQINSADIKPVVQATTNVAKKITKTAASAAKKATAKKPARKTAGKK